MRRLYWFLSVILSFVLLMPLALAQYGTGYFNITDFFNNTIVRFVFIFILFYAIIFFAVKNAFHGNRQIAIIVSMVVSLFITAALAQKGILEGQIAEDIGGLLILLGFLALFSFIFRVFYTKISKAAAFIMLSIIWLLLYFGEADRALPYFLQTEYVLFVYNILSSWAGLFLLIMAGIAVALIGKKKKGVHLHIKP